MTIFPTGLAEIVHESGYKLFIDIGTTLQITNNAFVATARHYGIQLGNTVRGIGFDAQPHPVATRILGD